MAEERRLAGASSRRAARVLLGYGLGAEGTRPNAPGSCNPGTHGTAHEGPPGAGSGSRGP